MEKFYLLPINKFTLFFSIILLSSGVVFATKQVFNADTIKTSTSKPSKIKDTRADKPSNGVKINVVPFKPAQKKMDGISPSKYPNYDSDKIINNVKVYPNPVSDQLNLTYEVNKDSNVTIKIMDVLGNEIITLLSAHMSAGVQNNSFSLASRLNSGFYFIRLIVGNETVIKRISVL